MVATHDWLDHYKNSTLSSLPKISLDHRSIMLKLEKIKKKHCPFKFENMWMTHGEFKNRISEWWQLKVVGKTMFRLTKNLDDVKRNLKI